MDYYEGDLPAVDSATPYSPGSGRYFDLPTDFRELALLRKTASGPMRLAALFGLLGCGARKSRDLSLFFLKPAYPIRPDRTLSIA
jgi:hypothetical protein